MIMTQNEAMEKLKGELPDKITIKGPAEEAVKFPKIFAEVLFPTLEQPTAASMIMFAIHRAAEPYLKRDV